MHCLTRVFLLNVNASRCGASPSRIFLRSVNSLHSGSKSHEGASNSMALVVFNTPSSLSRAYSSFSLVVHFDSRSISRVFASLVAFRIAKASSFVPSHCATSRFVS